MLATVLFYAPISLFGVWRWTYWLTRKTVSKLYRPRHTVWPRGKKRLSVSVITPVYNENERLFKQAIESWIANGVKEIIAVVDKSNVRIIAEFERRYFQHPRVHCRLVVTPKAGKRAALCDGISRATGDLLALVDSDTVWGEGVVEKALPHFLDRAIGGITVAQRISNPDTISNVLFDILLWTRYSEEVPFLLGVGRVFNTLSGRTAIYRREALLNKNHDNLHALRHEFFFATRAISGDDKRLTHLILEQGWQIGYAQGATVYTEGLNTMATFWKQRLRWTRNSWRADLRAISRGWVLKHPALAVFMIDRFIQPFFMLIGPVALVLLIVNRLWLGAAILVFWWLVSRTIRLFEYFKAHPRRLVYLPAYIIYNYLNALVKIYALVTIVEHTWATRWHKTRLQGQTLSSYLLKAGGAMAIIVFLVTVYGFLNRASLETAANIPTPVAVAAMEIEEANSNLLAIKGEVLPPPKIVLPTKVQHYIVQTGDTMSGLSKRLGIPINQLKKLNGIDDSDLIFSGQEILYY